MMLSKDELYTIRGLVASAVRMGLTKEELELYQRVNFHIKYTENRDRTGVLDG